MPEAIDNLSYIPGVNLTDERFTDAEIAQAEAIVAESLSARNPTMDLSPSSSLYDLHVRPGAINYLLATVPVEDLRATQSLKGVQENPELASDAIVDAIISNYNITRRSGKKSLGVVRVNVSRDVVYSIGADEILRTSNGTEFVPSATSLILSDPSGPEQIQLYPVDLEQTQFFFLLPVIAVEPGLASQLASDVEVIFDSQIPNFISAFTFGAFTGATDQETSTQLIERLPAALSAKNMVSRAAISSELKEKFPEVLDVTVQGFGSEAMLRGVGGLLPVKGGGFADIWVRTSLAAEADSIELVATLDSIDSNGRGICSCTVPATAYPGHFFVGAVLPGGQTGVLGTYPILSQSKSIITSGPKISSVLEGAYSKFQKTEVTFALDPVEGQPFPALGDEVSVDVELVGVPLVSEIQDFVSNHETRAAGTDYLVRASVPCFTWCSPITIHMSPDTSQETIRTAVFDYVNHRPMGQPIFVDGIVMAIRGVEGVIQVDLPIQMNGRIYAPDGSVIPLVSENSLVVPSRPGIQVIPETVAFYISVDDIAINSIISR